MSNPAYGFENLTHSGMLKTNSKDDKNVSMSFDVFNGNLSLVIFTGAGGKPWKQLISPKFLSEILTVLRNMRKEPQTGRQTFGLMAYDPEAKRFNTLGQLAFGFDESMTFQIDVQHNDLNGRHIFPIKRDGRIDLSNTSLTEKEIIQSLLDTVINILDKDVRYAMRMSSFKKQFNGQGGKPGGYNNNGGGNRNYGGNNSGGGYNNNRQNNNSSGGGGGSPFGDDSDVLNV